MESVVLFRSKPNYLEIERLMMMSSLEAYYSEIWNKVIDEIQNSGKIDKVILDSFYRTSTLVSLSSNNDEGNRHDQ